VSHGSEIAGASLTRAACSYSLYKSEHGSLFHKKYFHSHMNEEWIRQQFDPRRLEVLSKLRTESASLAAEEFDVAAALQSSAAAAAPPPSELTVCAPSSYGECTETCAGGPGDCQGAPQRARRSALVRRHLCA